MNINKRQDGETYEEYRVRLKSMNRFEEVRSKGVLVWDSSKRGTFRNPLRAVKKADRLARKAARRTILGRQSMNRMHHEDLRDILDSWHYIARNALDA